MNAPQAGSIVEMWERGAAGSATERGLLLMEFALPESAPEERSHLSTGHRDSCLIDLRERLFGSAVEAVSPCGSCGKPIAIDFDVGEIRAPYAAPGTVLELGSDERPLRFRLPDSADLLAIEGETDPGRAERRLLGRCLVSESPDDVKRAEAVSERISRMLADADPQAELILRIVCPNCSAGCDAPFDIVLHLWSEIEDWVVGLLEEVDRLAARYGWSERDILAMSHARRQAYLDLIEAVPT
ncbi:MAG TPA: hypothetical protein VEW71_09965 [Allosphingosinicella sp.]|nr:hypothetical protein [Allosphingosinicella sp.]